MYSLNKDRSFEINQYQELPPFSSFLPGIAGVNGIPMWVFYVSRGQGISSFGIQDKNKAISEFYPADKAYQNVFLHGFRTFVKIQHDDDTTIIEPFSASDQYGKEKMVINENTLKLIYDNDKYGFTLEIEYFILPHSKVAALVRHVKLKNVGRTKRSFEILDGIPTILPSGVSNAAYKELGHTLKSWFDVKNLEQGIPFYTLRGSMEDSAEVKQINEGNFYVSMMTQGEKLKYSTPIVDRDVIFGSDTSMQFPKKFANHSISQLLEQNQVTTNKVACGFSPFAFELEAQEEIEMYTVIGHASSLQLVQSYVKEVMTQPYLKEMQKKARSMTEEIVNPIETVTAQPIFDAYCRQSFLDNGLRGGFPVVFEKGETKKVFYLYSRKHGDLERDYNFFSISPTFYSQGNGNYRDINQNRRCDIFFEPKVSDANIKQFMSLIQLDGYNPLGVKGVRYKLKESFSYLTYFSETDVEKVEAFFQASFTPGELKHFIVDHNIGLTTDFEQLLVAVLLDAEELYQAEFGEGYWIDHWTYNLDLIESYLTIYPDKGKELFFERSYSFFDSPAFVKKRENKYQITNEKLRQYEAVAKDKQKLLQAASNDGALWVKTKYGQGEKYQTNLYSKLFLLTLIKTATLAPYGLGVEMEADKPGWNDSLNGLPGMLGSSTSELMEINRLIDLLLKVNGNHEVHLPMETYEFLKGVLCAIKKVDEASDESEHAYWNKVTSLREQYRESVRYGVHGDEITLSFEEVKVMLVLFKDRVETGIERVHSYSSDLPATYFYFEPIQSSISTLALDEIKWKPIPVVPFLEGIVKWLKVTKSKQEAKQIYDKVRASDIYDKKLGMYKTSMSIQHEPDELGRANSFTPGWLENESIFLHMEYKYLLEVLKAGLAEQFFEDMKKAMIPFLDPEMYGRSILENSSFIASSANPDPSLHGRGFVSRLSGSTIEFLNMWFVMMAGKKPFIFENETLTLTLSPTLPDWMFTEKGEVTFTFLGQCQVTYINAERKATFGKDAVVPYKYEMVFNSGEVEMVEGDVLKGQVAASVRGGEVKQMKVYLR